MATAAAQILTRMVSRKLSDPDLTMAFQAACKRAAGSTAANTVAVIAVESNGRRKRRRVSKPAGGRLAICTRRLALAPGVHVWHVVSWWCAYRRTTTSGG